MTVTLLILNFSCTSSQTKLLAELFRLLSSSLAQEPQRTQGETSSIKSYLESHAAHSLTVASCLGR